jgi:hypothetical protein
MGISGLSAHLWARECCKKEEDALMRTWDPLKLAWIALYTMFGIGCIFMMWVAIMKEQPHAYVPAMLLGAILGGITRSVCVRRFKPGTPQPPKEQSFVRILGFSTLLMVLLSGLLMALPTNIVNILGAAFAPWCMIIMTWVLRLVWNKSPE